MPSALINICSVGRSALLVHTLHGWTVYPQFAQGSKISLLTVTVCLLESEMACFYGVSGV